MTEIKITEVETKLFRYLVESQTTYVQSHPFTHVHKSHENQQRYSESYSILEPPFKIHFQVLFFLKIDLSHN